MDKLIETIAFAVGCLGSSILIFTGTYVIRLIYKFISQEFDNNNKKLIKDTIKEIDKKDK